MPMTRVHWNWTQSQLGLLHWETPLCNFFSSFFHCIRPEVAKPYILNSGFLTVAEGNNIVMIFPLTTKVPQNMNGCWDFFSYTGTNFGKLSELLLHVKYQIFMVNILKYMHLNLQLPKMGHKFKWLNASFNEFSTEYEVKMQKRMCVGMRYCDNV